MGGGGWDTGWRAAPLPPAPGFEMLCRLLFPQRRDGVCPCVLIVYYRSCQSVYPLVMRSGQITPSAQPTHPEWGTCAAVWRLRYCIFHSKRSPHVLHGYLFMLLYNTRLRKSSTKFAALRITPKDSTNGFISNPRSLSKHCLKLCICAHSHKVSLMDSTSKQYL